MDSSLQNNDVKQDRKVYEYIIELGIRLNAKSETIANASIYCYKCLKNEYAGEICIYTMATSCFLLAGKVTNDPKVSVRDVINISYCILHSEKESLEIGELLYDLRESLFEVELIVLRWLRFKLNFDHPHRHLIIMLAILRDWYPNIFNDNENINKVAGMFLQDFYVKPQIIADHRPKTIAVLVISMTFSALELNVCDKDWICNFFPNMNFNRFEKIKKKFLKEVYEVGIE